MSGIFDIIKATNNPADHVKHLPVRIGNLCKNPSLIVNDRHVNEKTAARLLHISTAELRKMYSPGEIAFIRHHRKALYHVDLINRYLAERTVGDKEKA